MTVGQTLLNTRNCVRTCAITKRRQPLPRSKELTAKQSWSSTIGLQGRECPAAAVEPALTFWKQKAAQFPIMSLAVRKIFIDICELTAQPSQSAMSRQQGMLRLG